MNDDFERRFRTSMDALHFSGGEKIRMAEAVEAAARRENGGTSSMKNKHIRKATLAIAVAAVLLLALAGVAAASGWFGWSPGLQRSLNVSDEQAAALLEAEDSPVRLTSQEAEDSGTRMGLASDTVGGVTLTAEQSVADASGIRVAVRITGADIPEGARLVAGSMDVTIDGQLPAGYGEYAYAGDTAPEYVFSDGSVEVDCFITPSAENLEGGLLGKEIEMRFNDLIVDPVPIYPDSPDTPAVAPAPFDPDYRYKTLAEGTWVLRWTLEGSGAVRTVALDAPLGDGIGTTVTGVTLSPLSAVVTYEFPSPTVLAPHKDISGPDSEGSGALTMVEVTPVPPAFAGVVLSDGTTWTSIVDGALGSYDETGTIFTQNMQLNHIIDPDAVTALLFFDKESGNGMYFTVPLE